MVWHIFRKDWKSLWPLVLLMAFASAISAMFWWLADHDMLPNNLTGMLQFFPLIGLLGSAILSIAVIQADPLPGDREDWLIRPIDHRDLLAAKFLFVLLAVATPVFAVGMVEILSDGFSFDSSVGAALGRSVALIVIVCLPGMVVGAITRNAIEAIVAAAVAAVFVGGQGVLIVLLGVHPVLRGSGLDWWSSAVLAGVSIAGALLILPLQYFHKYTAFSRLLAVIFLLLAIPDVELPWNPIFSAQLLLAPKGAVGSAVTVGFDPSLPRSTRTARDGGVFLNPQSHVSLINLPIRADGVAQGDVLFADYTEIRLIADGRMIYRQPSALEVRSENADSTLVTRLRQDSFGGNTLHGYQAILLPNSILGKVRAHQVTLELDYSLSLFRKSASANMAALNDSKHLDGMGWCRTRIDDDGDEAVVRCAQPGRLPTCFRAVLENPATGLRNPEAFACAPDYSPVPIHFIPDGLTRFYLEMKFRDLDNVAKYPVDEKQLGNARVNLTAYQPMAHFARHVVIRGVRLGDWEANPAP